MTNFERVKQEMRIKDTGRGIVCQAIHRLKNEGSCGNRTCEECQKWLAEEYVEPIVLSEAERTILENVDKQYKYIVRNDDGELCLRETVPSKNFIAKRWYDDYLYLSLEAFNHLFQFIKWEDSEPYEIAKLLEG